MTTGTKAILIFGTLALLSLLAVIGYWNQYLDARERTGIAAHTLLAIEADGILKGGDRLYAGTQAGVFQAVSSSKLLRMLGRPVSAWQPINLASPLFLIKNTDKKREDLNEQHISDELRADLSRYPETISSEVTIEVAESSGGGFVVFRVSDQGPGIAPERVGSVLKEPEQLMTQPGTMPNRRCCTCARICSGSRSGRTRMAPGSAGMRC